MGNFGIVSAALVLAVSIGLQLQTPGGAQIPAKPNARSWGNLQFIGPDTIADIASRVAPSVVNINATAGVSRQRAQPREDNRHEDGRRLKRYFGIDSPPGEGGEYMKVTGSGVIVRSDGHILTSLHVVENANKISVTLHDGRTLDGTLIARDRFSDLALIKIEAANLPTVKFGNAEQVRPGDWVVAIGNQFGLGHSVTHGLISGVGREAKGFDKSFGARTGAVRFMQTDASINPGSSGGPLVNLNGEVIGINTFIRDDAQNIGFAIPSNIASEVADRLVSGRLLTHPYIGIIMKETPVEVPVAEGLAAGVEVVEVKFRSPASIGGVIPGDVIMEIDDVPVRKSDDVSLAVRNKRVSDPMKLKLKRGGVDKVIEIKVDKLPESGDE